MKKKKVLFCIVLISSLCCVAVWYRGKTSILESILNSQMSFSPQEELDTRQPLRFLYLVQTESCISDHHKSPRVIGNASACQCDVLVLSYRKMCQVTPPAHVEYIFNKSTTWNSGRNLLFETAWKRNETYLYYIFMDDDIDLQTKTEKNPWRMHEDFLKRIEPALGAVDIKGQDWIKFVLNGRKLQSCSLNGTQEYLPQQYYVTTPLFHFTTKQWNTSFPTHASLMGLPGGTQHGTPQLKLKLCLPDSQ